MATNITGVSQTQPLSDPAPSIGGSFNLAGQISAAGGGGWAESGDMYFEWDQGTGNWTTIGSSGDLSTQDTNPLLALQTDAEQSALIDVEGAGNFQVRVKLIEDDLTTYTTTPIDVTVEDAAADRNVNVYDEPSLEDSPSLKNESLGPVSVYSESSLEDSPTTEIQSPLPAEITVYEETSLEDAVDLLNADLGGISVFDESSLEDSVSGIINKLDGIDTYDEVSTDDYVDVTVEAEAVTDLDINIYDEVSIDEQVSSVGGSEEVSIFDTISVDEDITVSVETTEGSTKWRLYITASVVSTRTYIPEIEYNDSIGGDDLCSGGTATASSYYLTNVPAYAFDDNTGTHWLTSVGSLPAWIEYEFPSVVLPEEITISAPSSSWKDYCPRDFKVQYWDGDEWQTVLSVYGASWSAYEVKAFPLSGVSLFDSISIDEDITISVEEVISDLTITVYDEVSGAEDSTVSVASGQSEIASQDFDDWIDGEPLVGPTGDGDFEEWVDGEPVVIVTEVGSGAPADRNISAVDNIGLDEDVSVNVLAFTGDLNVDVYDAVSVEDSITAVGSTLLISAYEETTVSEDVSTEIEEASAVSTKWRIYFDAYNTSYAYGGLAEIQLRTSLAGADQCSGGTATASSQRNAGTGPEYLFDDDEDTYWQTVLSQGDDWVQYEFTSEKAIVQYVLQSNAGSADWAPKDFRLQYYDGDSWITVDERTGETSWGVKESRTYTVGDARLIVVNDEVSATDVPAITGLLSILSVETYDEVSVADDTDSIVSSPNTSVYDSISVVEYTEGKVSDPQISVYDESSVSESVASILSIETSVYDEVTVTEDPASALSVEVWEDDPTTVEETISSFRNILAAGDIRDPGLGVKEIRIKLKAPAQNGYLVTGASIGVRDPGTEDYLPGTVARITFEGGASSAAVQQKDLWSDWVTFTAFDHTVDLMIHLDTALLDTVNWNQYSSNGDAYVKNGEWNDCMVEDISGYSLVNYSYNIKSLDVRASMVEGYDINVYDNESPSESVEGVTSGLEISVVDEVTLDESVAGVISTALNLSVYDEITLSEEVSGIISAVLLEVNDNVSVSEDVDGITSLAGVSVYDEISVSDVPSISYFTGTLLVSAYDEVTVSEAVELYHELYLSAVDTISVTDSPTVFVQLPFGVQVVEAVNVNDAVSVALSDISVSAHDTVTVGEDTSFSILLSAVTYDSVSVSDVLTAVTSACIISVSDEVNIAEAVTFAPEVVVTVHDTANLTDTATAVVSDLNVNTADAVAVSDSPTISVALPGPIDVPVLYDSATVTDVVSLAVSDPQISVYDSTAVVDDVDIFWELATGLLSISAEGLVCIIDAEGESLEVEANGEVMGISSEGEAFGIVPEGQSLQIDTEVV